MSLGDLLDFDNISINNGSRHEQGQKKTDGQFADTPSPSTETIIQRSSGWEDLPPLNAEPFTWDEDEQDGLVQELANKSLSVMEAQTDWEVLGLGWGATEEAVNQSFRRLILQLHPDKNPGDPEAAAKTSRVYQARERALPKAIPPVLTFSKAPEDKPFDPSDAKSSERYLARLRKGEERRAKEQARMLKVNAELERSRKAYKKSLKARVPAPKRVPIFDGRANPFSGNFPSDNQPLVGLSPEDRSEISQERVVQRFRDTHNEIQTSDTFGLDGTDKNVDEIIEVFDHLGIFNPPTSESSSRTTNHQVVVPKVMGKVVKEKNSSGSLRVKTGPFFALKTQVDDLIDFSDDEPSNLRRQANTMDPFGDLRSFLRGKAKQEKIISETPNPKISHQNLEITKEVDNARQPDVTKIAPQEPRNNGGMATRSSLDDIFQDLSTLILPNHFSHSEKGLHESLTPSIDSIKFTNSGSDRTNSIGIAHSRLAEKIQTRLHREERDRLELLKHRDPALYHQVKGLRNQHLSVNHDICAPSSAQLNDRRPSPMSISVKQWNFGKTWDAYGDTKTRVMTYVAQQEREKEEISRIRNRTASSIFEAHRHQAFKLRREMEEEMRS